MPDTAETAHITAPRSMAHLLRTTLMAVGILSLLLSVVGGSAAVPARFCRAV